MAEGVPTGPNPEDKLGWERGHSLIELLPAVMKAMLFLWDPIKTKMIVKFLVQLQMISE